MPPRDPDLHGNAPDDSRVVLVLVDVINALEFEGGDRLLPQALVLADRLAALAARARQARVPVIYANDNFGRWRSDFRALLERCLGEPVRGQPLAMRLRPHPTDDVVLKVKHSAFYSTTLDLLLRYLKAETLVLTGLTGDRCVLFSASDAYLRDFRLAVARRLRGVHRSGGQPARARGDGAAPPGRPERVHAAAALALGAQYAGAGSRSTSPVPASATSAACAAISRACRLSSPAAHGSDTGSTPVAVSRSPREARPAQVPPRACKNPSAANKRGTRSRSRTPRGAPAKTRPAARSSATASAMAPIR
jgi:nicotinamidase-related amidase